MHWIATCPSLKMQDVAMGCSQLALEGLSPWPMRDGAAAVQIEGRHPDLRIRMARQMGLTEQVQSGHPSSFAGERMPYRFPDDVQLQLPNDRIAKGSQCFQFAQPLWDAVERVDHPFATDRRSIHQVRKSRACWLHQSTNSLSRVRRLVALEELPVELLAVAVVAIGNTSPIAKLHGRVATRPSLRSRSWSPPLARNGRWHPPSAAN